MEPADADMLLKKVNQVVAESKSLNDIWSSDKDTMDSADNLYQAAKSLFEVVALLKDNIHEEAKPANNGSSLQSKYDQVRASLLSNDSVVRAKREYETYLLITNEFEQSHSKLANIIENK
ncbi:hypothetical protein OMP38_14710 [Cohnella ginsengisoli]|uniref:Uncharacterized protein n=1 Tax=Cohnella ginsengisoli TaxID=425004 RepID=A0A9X4KHA6_9BACL|nr:hypothetical protein [Cohnella ginsengisoli]MDG0791968.1 hypothetical protein [Cohnella ginsengisoli]